MSNIILGIAIIVICTIICLIALRFYKHKKYSIVLMLILFVGLILRIYVSNDSYLHAWDERYHALVAKNLIKHPLKPTLYDNPVLSYDYNNWVANHIWLDKGPIPLWVIAISINILGNTDIAVRIPSIIISLISIYLTFLIGTLLFDKKVGLLAAFFHSINGLIIEVAGGRVSSDHVETFFIFFIELAVLISIIAIIKKKGILFSALIGAIIGLAILCKWSPALIVFPLWIFGEIMVAKKTKPQIFLHLFVSIFTCCIVVVPWLWYINREFPNEAIYVFKKFIFAYNKTLEQHKGPFYYYFQNVGMVYGEIIWIPILISIYQIIKRQINWRMILLNIWWIIPFVIFSLAATKRPTYLLLCAPAMFIILSYYWFYIREKNVKKKVIRNIILAFLMVLPIRYCIERVKPFTDIERNPKWALELKQMKNKYDSKTIIINDEHAIEGMYYTDYIFYARIPNNDELENLQKKGYKVIFKKSDN
ncbi:MAG: glycosyltransferase family 39 protein [Bacteroidetes bacterium]|nr:glycosyltransferase family 39 protein [Bacteroidota bacterium]